MALTRANLQKLKPGRHGDTGLYGVRGLYLNVKDSGRRSFLGITKIDGKRRALGLGSIDDTGLVLARERWIAIRQRLRAGETPEQVRGLGARIPSGGLLSAPTRPVRPDCGVLSPGNGYAA